MSENNVLSEAQVIKEIEFEEILQAFIFNLDGSINHKNRVKLARRFNVQLHEVSNWIIEKPNDYLAKKIVNFLESQLDEIETE